MGSLECVARDVIGDPKATLGEILKKHPGLVSRPLDEALSKFWGYASNEASRVVEGRESKRDEVELRSAWRRRVYTGVVREECLSRRTRK